MKKLVMLSSVLIFCLTLSVADVQQKTALQPVSPVNPTVTVTELPQLLEGIWKGNDRYVFFVPVSESTAVKVPAQTPALPVSYYDEAGAAENTASSATDVPAREPQLITPSDLTIILKTYYGWFYDRTAEPSSWSGSDPRFRCTATVKEAEHLDVTFLPIIPPGTSSGAWQILITYGTKHDKTYIPVAVIGNKLYLDFALRSPAETAGQTAALNASLDGCWIGYGTARAIRICPMIQSENLRGWYIDGATVCAVRYWQVDAPYVTDSAHFTVGTAAYSVPKHIVSEGQLYTCAVGRSKQVRNIQTDIPFPADHTLDASGTICAFGKPYLTKVTGAGNRQQLMAIIAEANGRRKPDPKPLFPPDSVNWHWDMISLLEKDNEIVQAVRARQKEFAQTNGASGRVAAVQAASYSSYLKLDTEVSAAGTGASQTMSVQTVSAQTVSAQ